MFSLKIISIERYLVFKTNRQLEQKKIFHIIAFIYFVSFLLSISNSYCDFFSLECPTKRTNSRKILISSLNFKIVICQIFKAIFFSAVAIILTVIIYSYIRIFKIIRKKQLIRQKLKGNSRSKPIESPVDDEKIDDKIANRVQFKQKLPRRYSKSSDFIEVINMKDNIEPKESMKNYQKLSFSTPHLRSIASNHDLNQANVDIIKNIDVKRNSLNDLQENKSKPRFDRRSFIFYREFEINDQDGFLSSIPSTKEEPSSKKFNLFKIRSKKIQIFKSQKRKLEHKAIKNTLAPVIVITIFWLPFSIIQLLSLVFKMEFYEEVNLISLSLGLCHSAINPIVYYASNIQIKKAMKFTIKRITCKFNC